MRAVTATSKVVGVASACEALAIPKASYYRHLRPRHGPRKRGHQPRALSLGERDQVLDVLRSDEFVDWSPQQVWAALLDQDKYLCNWRTMYRILASADEVRERRAQRRHADYPVPQLLATKPNELWSWDITKLPGPKKWTYFHLYVVLDVFSRYIVGWMIAERESKALARKLLEESCKRQKIAPGQLTIHADRGSSMRSKPVALLMADLGVTKTHSRPHVSNDNPYSESQFKTLKYRPGVPERFGCPQHARSVFHDQFRWYNHEHRHTGIGLLTPYEVHHGLAAARIEQRQHVLAAAHARFPERFPHGAPRTPELPSAVWINKPAPPTKTEESTQ